MHFGLTSSDVLDTGLALQLRDASDLLLERLERLLAVAKRMALANRDVVMAGRTHGVVAEPTSFGHKVALWAFELDRDRDRLRRAREAVSVGAISGAVGTYAQVDPRIEEEVCARLGLRAAEASSQIVARDRHAELMGALAITASTLDAIATEIRHLARTEVREVQEPFTTGQKGSSAMPHKRNPVRCERVTGLARVIRGNLQVGAREHRAVARARHLAFVGRARDPARLDDRVAFHALGDDRVRSLSEAQIALGSKQGVLPSLLAASMREARMSAGISSDAGIKERAASSCAEIVRAEARRIRLGMGVLATIGATAPFVGLFGTVWGIMNSFIGISKAQTTNLAVVAPGIAEALLATAIGLVAAIPAVIIYNHFARVTKGYLELVSRASGAAARLCRATSTAPMSVRRGSRAAAE